MQLESHIPPFFSPINSFKDQQYSVHYQQAPQHQQQIPWSDDFPISETMSTVKPIACASAFMNPPMEQQHAREYRAQSHNNLQPPSSAAATPFSSRHSPSYLHEVPHFSQPTSGRTFSENISGISYASSSFDSPDISETHSQSSAQISRSNSRVRKRLRQNTNPAVSPSHLPYSYATSPNQPAPFHDSVTVTNIPPAVPLHHAVNCNCHHCRSLPQPIDSDSFYHASKVSRFHYDNKTPTASFQHQLSVPTSPAGSNAYSYGSSNDSVALSPDPRKRYIADNSTASSPIYSTTHPSSDTFLQFTSSDIHTENYQIEDDRDYMKKVKHQLSDRQRRAKIKHSMEKLKELLALQGIQKADQATVVVVSVELIKKLQKQVMNLKAKVDQLETEGEIITPSSDNRIDKTSLCTVPRVPYNVMVSALTGAGVSMLRVSLECKILEVNEAFELTTGWSSKEVVGMHAHQAPLFGSLSLLPKCYINHFRESSRPLKSEPDDASVKDETSDNNIDHFKALVASNNSLSYSKPEISALSCIYSQRTICNLPVTPQTELQPFFPWKSCSFEDHKLLSPNAKSPSSPHSTYMINHILSLPSNQALRLLCRICTSYGDTMEFVPSLAVIRNSQGHPDHILMLSTPDSRRLVKASELAGAADKSLRTAADC